ncbi:MAG: hypothetical protein MSH41_08005, partial [Bacteroidales bacterium]|nr:hypothetical protein [Bacteroidales bacterium]
APVLDNTRGTVYYATLLCGGEKNVGNTYANTQEVSIEHDYNENGFCTVCGAYQPATDSDSDGVYEIGNAGQLYWFAALVNGTDGLTQNLSANAVLTANITVNDGVLDASGNLSSNTSGFRVWTPIVGSSYPNYYAGTFDGQNHTVSGLYFNDSSVDNVGLFGAIGSSGKISNVGVVDSYFCGNNNIGGVCGAKYGTIENCYSASTVSGKNSVGGVCGNNYDGNLLNCYNTGAVIGTGWYIGGVCGIVNSGTIQNCYSTGTVGGSSDPSVGGVIGSNSGTITNCYYLSGTATGGINGVDAAGSAEGKAEAQFANGEVCYLLNGSKSDGAWGQTLSGTGKQDYPVLGGIPVYYRAEVYANTYGILTEGTQTITASNESPIWYEFTPTEAGSYQFSSTQLTAGNLYVNTTKAESDYTDIATSPTYDLEAATTYYVAINYAPGSYDLTITRLNNTPTAIETVTTLQIYAVDGRIVCDGEFRIYDLLGRDVTRLNGSLCGVYVVKTADAAQKVVVR